MSYDDEYYTEDGMDDNNSFVLFNPIERDDESNISSLNFDRKKQRNNEEIKNTDKGYHKLKRIINNRTVEIDIYSTKITPGTMIRDAITGIRFSNYRVGSINEHFFFKVAIATGELGNNGELVFFDSPEAYERHFKGIYTVPQETKKQWTNRCTETMNDNNNKKPYNSYKL
jgi:hypothetical protein